MHFQGEVMLGVSALRGRCVPSPALRGAALALHCRYGRQADFAGQPDAGALMVLLVISCKHLQRHAKARGERAGLAQIDGAAPGEDFGDLGLVADLRLVALAQPVARDEPAQGFPRAHRRWHRVMRLFIR